MAIQSQGSALYFLAPAGVSLLTEGTIIRVACIKGGEIPRGARGQIGTTCLDSNVSTFLAGTITPGAANFPLDKDPTKQGHKEVDYLYSALGSATTTWAFCWADGTAAPTSARGVASVAVTAGGSGYTTPPTVAFSGGGGTGAAATAVVENGVVVRIDVTTHGTGYTSAPTVALSGGGGTGATATATLGYRLVPPTGRTSETFEGYVADYPTSAAVNAPISTTLSVQISGLVTTNWKT
jgi:hypothetical protein